MSDHQPLFSKGYLMSCWTLEFKDYRENVDPDIKKRLEAWADKDFQKETVAESAFVDIFFKKIWGYSASGEICKDKGYSLHPQFSIKGAGQKGGTGKADLALGFFGETSPVSRIPQVLCEFKDISSGLDHKQNRKGNNRSPVKQCADYLKMSFERLFGNEPVKPTWGIVTDMNEFRLYYRKTIPFQYQRFIIQKKRGAYQDIALTDDSEEGAWQRFFFWKLFHSDQLLTKSGRSPLEKKIVDQGVHEKSLEKEFYSEYADYRKKLYETLIGSNSNFKGGRGKLVRLAQRLLDRFIFIMFCEDMGSALNFPRNLLRDLLIKESNDEDYDEDDDIVWTRVKKLFVSMRDGTCFREHKMNRFNGGIFEEDAELENLKIPTGVFCAKNQGMNPKSVLSNPGTLLFLSSKYNFGIREDSLRPNIGLYTLGRIFEQSITELEIMEADADGRDSLMRLSKRKTNGVYYTPEWVTKYIVDETIGARLDEIKKELGYDTMPPVTEEDIAMKYGRIPGKRKKNRRHVKDYLSFLEQYEKKVNNLKILDPACGSGAFLIQAFDRVVRERRWIVDERLRINEQGSMSDIEILTNETLSKNLYGVDLNPESVEITRLALWLRTASPRSPLCSLDARIRCGNSLVDSRFYQLRENNPLSKEEKERINAFDWKKAFPEVFQNGGFDIVIGNPPYVKLQNFRKIQGPVAEFLVSAKTDQNRPLYHSAQTGNFDLYLPFIEKGVGLLHSKGKMGYIAPNVWLVNEYGQGLRQWLLKNRKFDRWVDFKSHQVFEEASTYTAIQFFSGSENSGVRYFPSADGDVSQIDWENEKTDQFKFDELPMSKAWTLMPADEWALVNRLKNNNKTLEKFSKGITVGIQTSADYIYHLKKTAPNQYEHVKNPLKGVEVEIEDELMKPLVSGTDAKRYLVPETEIHLLFPYDLSGKKPRLWTEREMKTRYPRGWEFLKAHEKKLRGREKSKFNDIEWHRFGRNQNIDKQEMTKLGVAQTVQGMRVFNDSKAEFYFNNVRVNGILPQNVEDSWYLLGLLNAPVIDFVFKRIAKSKEGGFYEANKQFIAPLPIPDASEEQKQKVGTLAKKLQELHTSRRDKILRVERRLKSSQTEPDKRKITWIWAEAKNKEIASEKLEDVQSYLSAGVALEAKEEDGELSFLVGGVPIIEGIFEDEKDAKWIHAQWSHTARTTHITAKFTAGKLLNHLLVLRKTERSGLKKQTVALAEDLRNLEATIEMNEKKINSAIYKLYDLSDGEIKMIEAG